MTRLLEIKIPYNKKVSWINTKKYDETHNLLMEKINKNKEIKVQVKIKLKNWNKERKKEINFKKWIEKNK